MLRLNLKDSSILGMMGCPSDRMGSFEGHVCAVEIDNKNHEECLLKDEC